MSCSYFKRRLVQDGSGRRPPTDRNGYLSFSAFFAIREKYICKKFILIKGENNMMMKVIHEKKRPGARPRNTLSVIC